MSSIKFIYTKTRLTNKLVAPLDLPYKWPILHLKSEGFLEKTQPNRHRATAKTQGQSRPGKEKGAYKNIFICRSALNLFLCTLCQPFRRYSPLFCWAFLVPKLADSKWLSSDHLYSKFWTRGSRLDQLGKNVRPALLM